MPDGGGDFDDFFSVDQNFAGCGDFAGFDVKHARGVEDDGVRSRLRDGQGQGGENEQSGSHMLFFHIQASSEVRSDHRNLFQ
jgi:hypothetical protein